MKEGTGSNPVRRLAGEEDVLAWFRTPGVRTWRYRMYRPGVWSLVVLLGTALIAAVWLVVRSGLALLIHQLAFVLILGIALGVTLLLIRRVRFRYSAYVALNGAELLLGSGGSAIVIQRSALNVESVRFDDVQRSSVRGTLPIEAGGERHEIHLVGPFVHLQHLEALMEELLEDLKRAQES